MRLSIKLTCPRLESEGRYQREAWSGSAVAAGTHGLQLLSANTRRSCSCFLVIGGGVFWGTGLRLLV